MKITKTIRKDHEYILCYKKTPNAFTTNKYLELPNFEENYNNPDNDPHGDFKAGSISMKGNKSSSKYYDVTIRAARNMLEFGELQRKSFRLWTRTIESIMERTETPCRKSRFFE